MLEVGTEAPDFALSDQDEQPFSRSSQRGAWTLIWWYPKASTPGSTLQGQGLRDRAQQFDEAGCTVVGMSFDTPADNKAFREENSFPFRLLSDPDKAVGTRYEVLRDPDEKFADYPKRIAYLIDQQGLVAAASEVTDPAGYAAEALVTLAAAQR